MACTLCNTELAHARFIEGSPQTETWWLFESGVMDMPFAQCQIAHVVQARSVGAQGPRSTEVLLCRPRAPGGPAKAMGTARARGSGCGCVHALLALLEVPHGDRAGTSILVSHPVPEGNDEECISKVSPNASNLNPRKAPVVAFAHASAP